MDITKYTDQIQTYTDQIKESGVALHAESIPVLVAAIVFGLLICFFGLKLIKIWGMLVGLALGFLVGTGIALVFGVEVLPAAGIGLAAGLIMAILSFKIYRVGVFALCWVIGSGIVASFINPTTILLSSICAAIGLILAILAVIFLEPLVIIVTSLYGGLRIGLAVAVLFNLSPEFIGFIIGGVLALIGVVVQFLLRAKEITVKELKRADEIRAERSMETEVEAARAMLFEENEDDYIDEEDED